MIIDFHTHTFPERVVEKAMYNLSHNINFVPSFDGTMSGLLKDMERSKITYSISLPIATRPSQVEIINDDSIKLNKIKDNKIIYFGTMHPDYPNYKSELKRIKDAGIKGIKLHPIYQTTDIDSIKYINIVKEAFSLGLIVLFHAGLDPGFPGVDYSSYKRTVSLLDKLDLNKGVLILAHMGSLDELNESYEYILSRNVYIDTAMCIGTIHDMDKGFIDISNKELILKMIKKHGSEKVLFGSDNPWIDALSMVDAINSLPLREEEKQNIFYKNACRLLSIKEE